MVVKCAVIHCTNRKDREKDLQYYRLPDVVTNQGEEWEKFCSDKRRLWLAKLNQDFTNKNLDNIRICSAHYISGKKAEVYDRTNPGWVPSIGLGGHRVKETPETPQLQRYNRAKGRTNRKLVPTPITEVQEPLSELASVTIRVKMWRCQHKLKGPVHIYQGWKMKYIC